MLLYERLVTDTPITSLYGYTRLAYIVNYIDAPKYILFDLCHDNKLSTLLVQNESEINDSWQE